MDCETCGMRKANWKLHRDYVLVGDGVRKEMWFDELRGGTVLGTVCTGHSDAVVVNLRGGCQAVYLDQRRVAGPFTSWADAKAWVREQGAGVAPAVVR